MSNSILAMITKKEPKWTTITVRVPADLHSEVKLILEQKKLSWNALIAACLRKFKLEVKGRE